MQPQLYYFLCFVGVMGPFTVVVMSLWYWRVERRERLRQAQTKADIADIMILFQTMRDVISQQKNLARDFNQELERKMALVKEVLAKSLEKNEKLYERQQELQGQIEDLKAELESAQRQAGYLRSAPLPAGPPPMAVSAPAPTPAPAPAPAAPKPAAPKPAPVTTMHTPVPPAPKPVVPRIVHTEPTPPPPKPEVTERLEKTGLTDAPYSVWFGLDFDAAPAPVEEEEEPVAPPRAPEDPEAARNAFRALLNLPAAPRAASPEAMPYRAGDNGASPPPAMPAAVPLQQRVLEYSEAGMGVAEIARELGIGKGEVRLMLSLAKQKGA